MLFATFLIGGGIGYAAGWYFNKPTAEQREMIERGGKPRVESARVVKDGDQTYIGVKVNGAEYFLSKTGDGSYQSVQSLLEERIEELKALQDDTEKKLREKESASLGEDSKALSETEAKK